MTLIAHEDEHLLVARKPAGWNTHAPSPFANEGLYDWLKNREPRWSRLSVLHRLDKETSGLIVFGKTAAANRSLAAQFETRQVSKKYQFLTDRPSSRDAFTAKSKLARAGDKYTVSPAGQPAETRFRFITHQGSSHLWEATPITGRTHQIRVHAADHGLPILGDTLYGGAPAPRLCLHAAELTFACPATARQLTFQDPPDFTAPVHAALRHAIIDPAETNAFRLLHGAADGWPGLFVDRLADFVLASSGQTLTPAQKEFVLTLSAQGALHKRLERQPGQQSSDLVAGQAPPPQGFVVHENGLNFKVSLAEGYSCGLFLDQRDNRRRFLTTYIAPDFNLIPHGEVLNTFAYTCSFSVAAAAKNSRTTSIDLSRKYLDWGRENFRLNSINPDEHEFLTGDVFDWLARLARKKRVFDTVILDPPTFSRSKESGVFRAEKDYERLARAALPLLKAGGILFASTNAATYQPEEFIAALEIAAATAHRRILQRHYAPQPPDFPIHRSESAYLKTLWLKVE